MTTDYLDLRHREWVQRAACALNEDMRASHQSVARYYGECLVRAREAEAHTAARVSGGSPTLPPVG
jgi:hypothetical protein